MIYKEQFKPARPLLEVELDEYDLEMVQRLNGCKVCTCHDCLAHLHDHGLTRLRVHKSNALVRNKLLKICSDFYNAE